MKKLILLFVIMLATRLMPAQINAFNTSFYSVSLEDTMPVRVYLPPGYDDHPDLYYPVIYLLPGWAQAINVLDGMMVLAQQLINEGTIDPVIMVCPFNIPPPFNGSMYVNSILWGNYEDYNVNDVTEWVESNFRAMPYRDYRALLGHSMGGYGAFRYSILHKDKFKALAAHAAPVTNDSNLYLEPCRQAILDEHPGGPPYYYDFSTDGVFTQISILFSGAFTPNLNSPQTYINPPIVDYPLDESGQFIDSTQQAWLEFAISHLLPQLSPEDSTGIFFGCGSSDPLLCYPPMIALKDTLEMLGLPYEFYDHSGGHVMPYGFKVRALTFLDSLLMPPDFNTSVPVNPEEKKVLSITIYPNPAYEIVHIGYEIENPSHIELKVFNAVGEMVAVLQDGYLPKGKHRLDWNAAGLPSGLYFCKVIAGKESANLKLIRQ